MKNVVRLGRAERRIAKASSRVGRACCWQRINRLHFERWLHMELRVYYAKAQSEGWQEVDIFTRPQCYHRHFITFQQFSPHRGQTKWSNEQASMRERNRWMNGTSARRTMQECEQCYGLWMSSSTPKTVSFGQLSMLFERAVNCMPNCDHWVKRRLTTTTTATIIY